MDELDRAVARLVVVASDLKDQGHDLVEAGKELIDKSDELYESVMTLIIEQRHRENHPMSVKVPPVSATKEEQG